MADNTLIVAAYVAGKSVDGVAKEFGVTYGQARKVIVDSGTPIRDASARLKGKTRTKKSVL
jgi:hypothetical protein